MSCAALGELEVVILPIQHGECFSMVAERVAVLFALMSQPLDAFVQITLDATEHGVGQQANVVSGVGQPQAQQPNGLTGR